MIHMENKDLHVAIVLSPICGPILKGLLKGFTPYAINSRRFVRRHDSDKKPGKEGPRPDNQVRLREVAGQEHSGETGGSPGLRAPGGYRPAQDCLPGRSEQ